MGSARLLSARLVPALVLAFVLVPSPARTFSLDALLAPKAELWERWTANDPKASARIDHRAWDHFLERYVSPDGNGVNRVSYGRVSADDRWALGRYIARLAATPIGLFHRTEQLAFWINLYNALTVRLVLKYDGIKSIRDIDISPGLFAQGPWGKKLISVEGEELSLNDIEHRILRPIWRDARIHYAVNCAAVGCPNLERQAFTGDNAEAMLTAAARAYVNNPRGVRIEGGKLIVSSLYLWYKADFAGGGGTDAGVIAHLRTYADAGLAARLLKFGRIGGDAYDWALNAWP